MCEIGCGDGARVICSLARVIKQIGFWTQKIQANVDHCYVWRREQTRRVQFARPWTQASKPALTVYSLAAKIRTVALHVAFFSTKNLCPARCCCCCRCVYSRMIYLATKDARCVHCSSWSLGPSPRRPTASYNSLAAVRRGDCVRKS